jgi:hypothetical protein
MRTPSGPGDGGSCPGGDHSKVRLLPAVGTGLAVVEQLSVLLAAAALRGQMRLKLHATLGERAPAARKGLGTHDAASDIAASRRAVGRAAPSFREIGMTCSATDEANRCPPAPAACGTTELGIHWAVIDFDLAAPAEPEEPHEVIAVSTNEVLAALAAPEESSDSHRCEAASTQGAGEEEFIQQGRVHQDLQM